MPEQRTPTESVGVVHGTMVSDLALWPVVSTTRRVIEPTTSASSRLPANHHFPGNLVSTAPLTIAENQPIGTIVGEFNATDPDAGATLTYHLVSGAGDTHNTLFTLETNGTLKTVTTFDYESNGSTYSIRVQAKDEFNATVEGNFTVTLTDWFDDSWDKLTGPSRECQFGMSVSLSGNILAVGANGSDPGGVNAAGAAYPYELESNGSATYLTEGDRS